MANYLKPQSPLQKGTDYIYPLTTADQVLVGDEERLNAKLSSAVYLDSSMIEDGAPESVNADTLGGNAPDYYAEASKLESVCGNVGTIWEDISSQYAATIDNTNISVSSIDVRRRGIFHHMRITLKANANITAGTKITVTFSKGQMPAWPLRFASGSVNTIGIGELKPDKTMNIRLLNADMPSGNTIYFGFEYVV